MPKLATREMIYCQQRYWARRQEIEFDADGYTLCLIDNLFEPLSPETITEFTAGAGDELGRGGKRGKMQALHSSSALVCNVFDYWRVRGINSIARACGAPDGMTEMCLEQTHPTGLEGTPPHLDVEFSGVGLKPLAVESKFTEQYHRKTKRKIKDKYLIDLGLWAKLPGCERLVRLIREEEKGWTTFSYLDVP